MSPREDQTGGWRTEAEAASASGGHILPDPTGLYDQRLTAATPAPPVTLERRGELLGESTGRRRRPAGRRVQRTMRRVDVWSVFKLSIFYYSCFIILWLGFVAVLYRILSSAGLFVAIQKFGKAMVLWKNVNITLGYVEKWALLLGIVFLVVGSLANALIAFLYNLAADTVGGIEVTFVEKEARTRHRPDD
ncbi:MAG: DUF3566 domain-containing protein [Actinomycetota bacterium]|nr:DUF3566 domain-containing protein [Actinomycetota bacterium]